MRKSQPTSGEQGKRRRSPRRYVLYAGPDNEPRSQWQYCGKPRLPGCTQCNVCGHVSAPPIRWVVRAKSVRQACYFVHNEQRAADSFQLGILWDRERDWPDPPPLGDDLTQYHAVIAQCRTLTITLWFEREDAERAKELIDRFGCGGDCRGAHRIILMTKDEAERRRPEWWDGPGRWPDSDQEGATETVVIDS